MPHPHHDDPHRPSARDIRQAIDPARVEGLLARWVADDGHRRFLARCMLDEGPAHHRGASFAILALLRGILDRLPAPRPEAAPAPSQRVPLRLEPHLRRERAAEAEYPLDLPEDALAEIVPRGSPEERALIDSLVDGPAHHALANVAMVRALREISRALDGAR